MPANQPQESRVIRVQVMVARLKTRPQLNPKKKEACAICGRKDHYDRSMTFNPIQTGIFEGFWNIVQQLQGVDHFQSSSRGVVER